MGKFKVGDRVVWDRTAGGADIVEHWNMFWRATEGDLTDDVLVVTRVTDNYTHYSNRAGGKGPCVAHQYLKLAPLKIETGKFYRTRDGRKVGPALINLDIAVFGDRYNQESAVWVDNGRQGGRYDIVTESPGDIIAEWVDDPKAQNDNRPPWNAIAKMPKFNVGDVVRPHFSSVSGTIERVDDATYHINYGPDWGYRDFREDELVLVIAAPVVVKPTAIVALIENGQPKPSALPYVHRTVESANTEAKRLAGKHRGKKFGVYVLQSTEELAAPIYGHNWQTLAAKGEKIAAIKELRSITGLGLKATKDAVEHWLAYDEPVSRIAA